MDYVLVFAGGDGPSELLREELPGPDLVIAADSGYQHAVALGYRVDVLVGDLDSMPAGLELPARVRVERHPEDKDATDLELALAVALEADPRRVVVVGGTGGRHDHELAIPQLLASDRWASIPELDWVTRGSTAHVVRDRRMIQGDIGTVVTLIPMGGPALGVKTRGLAWSLDGDELPYGTTRGVSNLLASPVASIEISIGTLLVVIPRT